MKSSSNVVGDSSDESNFPHKLLLTNKKFQSFVKLSQMIQQVIQNWQWGGFLGKFLGPFLQPGLFLIENVLKPLDESVLIPLELIAAASVTNAAIHKKMFRSGTTTLIISNEEMNDIMKIVKNLEESGLLIKNIAQTIKNESKE